MNYPILIIVLNLVAGTTLIIFGVNLMGNGLESLNANVIRKVISRLAGSLITAFAAGTALTALVQSSTAVVLTAIRLVNTGAMSLTQATVIVYGANIGTTITAQLMSFRITDAAVPMIAIGLLLTFAAKKAGLKSIARAMTGFGLMLAGLALLNSGAPLIRESKLVYEIFKNYGSNPYLALVIGIIATAVVQSSSATIGLTIVLFNSGLIGFEGALGLTLGGNIGTCVTALLASFGTGSTARRTAWSHVLYNVIGTLAALLLLDPFSRFIRIITHSLGQDENRLIANAHSIFNILSAAVFLPLTGYYVKFIEWLVPEKPVKSILK